MITGNKTHNSENEKHYVEYVEKYGIFQVLALGNIKLQSFAVLVNSTYNYIKNLTKSGNPHR